LNSLSFRTLVLVSSLSLIAACGDKANDGAGSASATSSSKPATTASGKASAAPTAAAAALPDGIIPVAKLVDAVKADAKGTAGKKVQSEGIYWGMSTETSGDKKTYVLDVVASKTDTDTKIHCNANAEPKDLPSADNQAHDQAIDVIVEGTLQTSGSRPTLTDCTYKKK
jgi:hypothetical protein